MFKKFLEGASQFFAGAALTCVSMVVGYIIISYHVENIRTKSYEDGYKVAYAKGFHDGLTDNSQIRRENLNWETPEKTTEPQKKDMYQELIKKIDEFDKTHSNIAEYYVDCERMIDRVMEKSNPDLSKKSMGIYKDSIIKWSREYGLSPIFVASMVHRESNFKEQSVSSVNAKGPLQVVAKYHKDKLSKLNLTDDDLHDIDHGIRIGCQVIKEYLVASKWNYRQALYKYVGAVKNKKTAEGYVNDIFDMICYAYN